MRIWIRNLKSAVAVSLLGGLLAGSSLAQDEESLSTITYPDPNGIIEDYQVVDQPLEGVLEILSDLTGRSILRPQQLPTPQITFDSRGPITRAELILAIESLLSLNQIGVSPLGDRFLKIVQLGEIRTQAPELVTGSLADRAPSGKVVSKLFRFEHLDSQTFQQQIQPFLSPTFSSIIPFQNSNAVIVTDTVSNLQRLEYVVSEVDKPSRLNISPVFFTLQYAQASEVAQQIQGMIDDARNRFGNPNAQQGGGPRIQGGERPSPESASEGEGGGITQILFGSSTAISSDDRTNQIIIMTEPSNLAFFEGIIQKLDIKADPSTRIEVIPLKHANAEEVASLLSQFVSGGNDSNANDRAQNNRREGDSPASRFNRRVTFGDSGPQQPPARETVSTASPSAGSDDRDSQFSSFMTIIADERSNSLVISGTRSDLDLMTVLVEKIDVLLPQVRIEVIIAEVNLTEDEGITRGMDAFSAAFVRNEDDTTTITTPIEGGPGFNFLGLGLGGTFNYNDGSFSVLTLDAVFNTARSDSNVTLLSVPTLTTTHNKEASISVGEARPIVTGSQTSSISDNVRSTVQYQDIGIELTVTPLIGPNDVIQLEIDQTIDDVVDTVTIDSNEQPVIGRRQAVSYVSVSNGELVVLGGLQRNRVTRGKSKGAFFGEIPIIGGLFNRRGKDQVKSELLVFIRPLVVRSTDDVNDDADAIMDRIEAGESIEHFMETGELEINGDPDEDQDKSKKLPKGPRK